MFRTAVAMNFRPEAIGGFMGQLSAEEVAAFQADRAELAGDAPMVAVSPDAAISAFNAYLTQLEASLTDAFLYGAHPSIADFSVYHCLWFVDQNPVNAVFIEPFAGVREWMDRMAGFGHGRVTEASGEDALAHAKQQAPVLPELQQLLPADINIGDEVAVTPTDYGKVPVTGTLVAASAMEVVVERETAETGTVMTHFPSIGFQISRA